MGSTRQFVILFTRLLFALVVCSTVLTLLIRGTSNPARARIPQAQNDEKSLNIERYPNEPFELLDVKIGSNSVKSNIKEKFRDKRSQIGIDHVKFRDEDDWSKKMKIRLRNVSGRAIYGMSASLFFEHYEPRMAFEISLDRMQHRNLKSDPLQPGDEVDLEVTDAEFSKAMARSRKFGLNPNELIPVLSVRSALFTDDFGWFGGTFMRRDPNNPQKWDAVDKDGEHPEASRLENSAGFIAVALNIARVTPQTLQTCQANRGGFLGYPCT